MIEITYLLKLVDAVLIGRAELPISEVRGMARSRVAASLSEQLITHGLTAETGRDRDNVDNCVMCL